MKDLFTAEFFTANRQKLLERRSQDVPIVLTANGLVQRAGDSGFPFRQDSNFWYLTGLQDAELVVVITPTSEFIILPERSSILDVFDGAINNQQLIDTSGIEKIYDYQTGWEVLRTLAVKHQKLYTALYKGYDDRHNLYFNPTKPRLVSQLKKLHSDMTLLDIRRDLAHLRMIKQAQEIAAIEAAIKVTGDSLQAVMTKGWAKQWTNEADIERELTYQFAHGGSKQHAYPPIIASGKNACTLHYSANQAEVETDQLLLIDAGAEYSMYAADITRMYAPGVPTERQQAVFDAVSDVQKLIIGLLKPGLKMRDIEDKVERAIGKQLKALGLIKAATDRTAIRKYYPHSFSHHLGLDVHDAADYDIKLKSGMVITVEPGIYIEDEAIGVRIEDDVLITDTGCRVLSADLPSRLR